MEHPPQLTREAVSNEIMLASNAADEAAKQRLERLLECRLDLGKKFPFDGNILFYNGVPFLRKGNISIIQGKPKAGKSFFCSMLAATAIAGEYEGLTSYGKKGVPMMLYFDTEQSEEDATELAKRILKMAKMPTMEFPPNFSMFSFRKKVPEEARELLEAAIMNYKPTFVIIDGITDLVDSPNDEKESKERVAWLYNLAEDHGTHIMVVIHENPGAYDKARGHIGSELERKLETAVKLEVKKEENYRIKRVEFKLTRKKAPENFQFVIDNDAIPQIESWTTPAQTAQEKQQDKPNKEEITIKRLEAAYGSKISLSYNELIDALIKHADVAESTASRVIKAGIGFNQLRQEDKRYILVKNELPFTAPPENEKIPF